MIYKYIYIYRNGLQRKYAIKRSRTSTLPPQLGLLTPVMAKLKILKYHAYLAMDLYFL